jgi:hypothetical protein
MTYSDETGLILEGDTVEPPAPCFVCFVRFIGPFGKSRIWEIEFGEGMPATCPRTSRGRFFETPSGVSFASSRGREYRVTFDHCANHWRAERILPTSPHRECITYELGDRPPCAPQFG